MASPASGSWWKSCACIWRGKFFVGAFGAMPDVNLDHCRSQDSYIHPQSYTLLNTRDNRTKVLRHKYTVFMRVTACEELAEACASRTHRRHQRCRPPVLKTG